MLELWHAFGLAKNCVEFLRGVGPLANPLDRQLPDADAWRGRDLVTLDRPIEDPPHDLEGSVRADGRRSPATAAVLEIFHHPADVRLRDARSRQVPEGGKDVAIEKMAPRLAGRRAQLRLL